MNLTIPLLMRESYHSDGRTGTKRPIVPDSPGRGEPTVRPSKFLHHIGSSHLASAVLTYTMNQINRPAERLPCEPPLPRLPACAEQSERALLACPERSECALSAVEGSNVEGPVRAQRHPRDPAVVGASVLPPPSALPYRHLRFQESGGWEFHQAFRSSSPELYRSPYTGPEGRPFRPEGSHAIGTRARCFAPFSMNSAVGREARPLHPPCLSGNKGLKLIANRNTDLLAIALTHWKQSPGTFSNRNKIHFLQAAFSSARRSDCEVRCQLPPFHS